MTPYWTEASTACLHDLHRDATTARSATTLRAAPITRTLQALTARALAHLPRRNRRAKAHP